MTWALKVLSTVVLSPQLTPADSSSLSDYSSEPALYFWSLGPISCTVASHPWDQTAARAQPGLPHLGLNCLQLYTPAASKHIFLIRQETMFCSWFFCFFLISFRGGVDDFLPRYHRTPRYQLHIRAGQLFVRRPVFHSHLLSDLKSKSSWTVFPPPPPSWTVDLSASLLHRPSPTK